MACRVNGGSEKKDEGGVQVRRTSSSVVGEGLSAKVTLELSSDDEEKPGMRRLGRLDGVALLAGSTACAQSLR